MAKKLNLFEQRRRAIDQASGWGEPEPVKKKKKVAVPVKKKPTKGY